MIQKIQSYIEELHMIEQGDRVLVGISGGADSVALLLLLKELQMQKSFSLEAVHVEHGIRGEESRQDAYFAERLCERLGVPFFMEQVDVPAYAAKQGIGLEEMARILRYEVFCRYAKMQGAKIALAHHMEDNVETILFQMVRGSGLTGLCGMKPIRTDEQGVTYIRPLLKVHRKEIERFLAEKEQHFCIDSTNQELEYSRNFLRNRIVPALAEINTEAVEHISQTADVLSEIRDYLDVEKRKVCGTVCQRKERGWEIDTGMLAQQHPVLQKEILYEVISEACGGKKDITAGHVADLLSLCQKQSGKALHLPGGVLARKEFGILKVWNADMQKEDVPVCHEVTGEALKMALETGKTLKIPLSKTEELLISVHFFDGECAKIPQKPYTKWFDYDKIKNGFCIRNRKSGDYFICDVAGHRKKLKQYLVDEKIPQTQRDRMWLISQEHQVVWLIGGRISEHVKVTGATNARIEIIYVGGAEDELRKR